MRIPARIAYGAAPFVFVAFGCSGVAHAQNPLQAYVVGACGTPGITLTAGKYGPVFQNTSGTLCTVGSTGSASATNITQIGGVAVNPAIASTGALAVDEQTSSQFHIDLTSASPGLVATNNTTNTYSNGSTAPINIGLNGGIFIDKSEVLTSGTVGAPSSQYVSVQGGYFYNVVSSVLTRASNTATYSANETVCLFTGTTVCAPITIQLAGANKGQGIINRVSLLKSGTNTTTATFTIWMFSAAPGTATPNQFDATAYAGPRAADMPNYIGNAQCNSPVPTSDTTTQVWYDCALSNPNTSGALVFQALSGATTIDALISVTATYTASSAETFTAYVSGIY